MTHQADPVDVVILTGFLGSGKTTLLNGLLSDPGFGDAAVIVNEFGDIGIDHLLVRGGEDGVMLLESGCICCAAGESLPDTLLHLWGQRERGVVPHFTRLVIETSGLADPAPIAGVVMKDRAVAARFRLSLIVVTIDTVFGVETLHAHHEAAEQLALADLVVLTKTDRADAQEERVRAELALRNSVVPVVLAADVLADPQRLTAQAAARDNIEALDPHHHHASWQRSWRLGPGITWSGIAAFIDEASQRFGADLLRCKGFLSVEREFGPVLLQGVRTIFETTRMATWPDDDQQSRLVCIFRRPVPEFEDVIALLGAEQTTIPVLAPDPSTEDM